MVDDEALRRARRLREVFGDVLPDTPSDERPEHDPPDETDRRYRENRPPHHE